MVDVFRFIQTVFRTESLNNLGKVINTTWTEPLKHLGQWVRLKSSDSQLTWVPFGSTKNDVIQAIFGKKIVNSIQQKYFPYKGTEVLVGNNLRISFHSELASFIHAFINCS